MRRRRPPNVLPATIHPALYGLLGSQILLSVMLFGSLPFWVPALAITVYLFCALSLNRGWPLPPTILLVTLGIAAIIGVWLWFHTLNGAPAGVSLLLLIAALKSLETRSHRDLVVLTLISCLLTTSEFLFGQGIARSAIALVNLVWLITILGRLHSSNSLHAPSFLLELRASILRMITAIPLMLLLFVLFPRIEGPIWGSTPNRQQGITGLSDRMSPGSLSRLVRSSAIAFRAHLDGEPPPPHERYWRAYVLNRFNGSSWLPSPQPGDTTAHLDQVGTPLSYIILIKAKGQYGLPTLGLPINVPRGTHLVSGYTLRTEQAINSLQDFHLKVALGSSHLGGPVSTGALVQDLRLPEGYAPKARALVHAWLARDHQPQAVIAAALHYFHTQPFYYTLSPPRLEGDITDRFLFVTRQGFCEDYGSAFAVLMRLAGIPARIVVGYMGGIWNPSLDYFTVNEADAHAWVEVWLKKAGWVRIDPTAAIAATRVESGIESTAYGGLGVEWASRDWLEHWTNNLRAEWDTAGYLWDTFIIAFGPAAQRALLHRMGLQSDWLSLAIELTIGFCVLAGLGFIWNYRGQRPLSQPAALRLYRKYLQRLKHHGLVAKPNEGALELAQRVGQQWPEYAQKAFHIAQCYYEARYAHATAAETVQRLARLRMAIRDIRLSARTQTTIRR